MAETTMDLAPGILTTNPPEQGQLVEVRQRRYVVSEVKQSALPHSDPIKLANPNQQTLVNLSSIEDDALGEELQGKLRIGSDQ